MKLLDSIFKPASQTELDVRGYDPTQLNWVPPPNMTLQQLFLDHPRLQIGKYMIWETPIPTPIEWRNAPFTIENKNLFNNFHIIGPISS